MCGGPSCESSDGAGRLAHPGSGGGPKWSRMNAMPDAEPMDSRAPRDVVHLSRRPLSNARRVVGNVTWRAGRVSQRVLRRPVILAYHRIATVARDPLLLAVRPEHFSQQLDVLARITRTIPLSELAEAMLERGGVRGTAVITFDDGYLDNLTEARPELGADECSSDCLRHFRIARWSILVGRAGAGSCSPLTPCRRPSDSRLPARSTNGCSRMILMAPTLPTGRSAVRPTRPDRSSTVSWPR